MVLTVDVEGELVVGPTSGVVNEVIDGADEIGVSGEILDEVAIITVEAGVRSTVGKANSLTSSLLL